MEGLPLRGRCVGFHFKGEVAFVECNVIASNPDDLHVGHAIAETLVIAVDAEEDPWFRGQVEALIREEPSVFVGGGEAAEWGNLGEVGFLLEEELVDGEIGIRSRAAGEVEEVAGVADCEIPISFRSVGVQEQAFGLFANSVYRVFRTADGEI